MKTNNYLGTAIDITEGKATYDHQAKLLLSNVYVLAWILKYTIVEFKDCDIETIIGCIDADSRRVASVPVHGGISKETVKTLSQENFGANEGEITFDVRFEADIATSNKTVMIDVEAQKKYHVGYNIVTRGFVYDARMISEQVNAITTDNYDLVQNVYSIWICTSVPRYLENTIAKYHINRQELYGAVDTEYREDLMCVVVICLGRDIDTGSKLHQMLATTLSDDLSAGEKKKLLEEKFHIPVTREMEEEMSVMCNLSDLIEERGINKGIEEGREEGREQTVLEYLQKGYITIEVAAEDLKISVEEVKERLAGKE